MTDRHTMTEVDLDNAKTVVDHRRFDPLETSRTSDVPRFARPSKSRSPRFSVRLDGKTLERTATFVSLAVAIAIAIHEHRAANGLRAATSAGYLAPSASPQTGQPLSRESAEPPRTPRKPVLTASIELDPTKTERRAVDAVVINDDDAALRHFETLHGAFPDDGRYADFVTALRWRLRCNGAQATGADRCE